MLVFSANSEMSGLHIETVELKPSSYYLAPLLLCAAWFDLVDIFRYFLVRSADCTSNSIA